LFTDGDRLGVWNLTSRSPIWGQASYYRNGAAASSDCRLVARGSGYQVDNHGPYQDTGVELYDGRTGEMLSAARHRTIPQAMAFTLDGSSFIAGGLEGELRFWSWSRGEGA